MVLVEAADHRRELVHTPEETKARRPKVYYRVELAEGILRGAARDLHPHPSPSRAAREARDVYPPRDTGRARLAPHWSPRCGGIQQRRSRRSGSIWRPVTAAEAAARAGARPRRGAGTRRPRPPSWP